MALRIFRKLLFLRLFFTLLAVSGSVWRSENTARTSKVRHIYFPKRLDTKVNFLGSDKGRLSTLSSEGARPLDW